MTNNFNQGGFNQGGFNQGGFGQPNGQFNPQQNQVSGNGQSRNYSSFVKFQAIANLVNDPESKPVGGAKVATAPIAINHAGENGDTDYWTIEVWANQGQSSSVHDFLMDHCKKGRQVFVEGVPHLKRRKRQINGQDVLDQNGKPVYDYYPTVRVNVLRGLGGGQNNNNQQQKNQQNNLNQQQQQNNGFAQAPQGQGGFGQPGFAPQGNFGQPQQPAGQFGPPQFAHQG